MNRVMSRVSEHESSNGCDYKSAVKSSQLKLTAAELFEVFYYLSNLLHCLHTASASTRFIHSMQNIVCSHDNFVLYIILIYYNKSNYTISYKYNINVIYDIILSNKFEFNRVSWISLFSNRVILSFIHLNDETFEQRFYSRSRVKSNSNSTRINNLTHRSTWLD